GDLDVYVANYVRFQFDQHRSLTVDGFPQYRGPKDFEAQPDVMYRNNGDGTFSDVSREAGLQIATGTGMGTLCLDFDDDRDTDIVVLNDVMGNFLWQNDGRGQFEEVGLIAGIGYNADGLPLGSMGLDSADYDRDGRLDVYQTSYANELPALYRNLGGGLFQDVTKPSGAGAGLYPHVNWGAGFVDFENDGDCDLYIANGHLQDNVHRYSDTTTYETANSVLLNEGNGRFRDVSSLCGEALAERRSSRGIAIADLDQDGRCDVVVSQARSRPTLLRNESQPAGHWISVRLHGRGTNRDGVGARIRVMANGVSQVREVHSGRGYQSHWGTEVPFGLAAATAVDEIYVQWIGGGEQVVKSPPIDRVVHIVESGSGRP
ncbi:MAG: CRTAC1 family protein, partial [Planctomycetales bacterium]|nr:CRTAC1 family protein [Planctomycetales bacterium]